MTPEEFINLKAGDKVLSCNTLTGMYSGWGNAPAFVIGHSVELTCVSNHVFSGLLGDPFKIMYHKDWPEGIAVNCEDIVLRTTKGSEL